MPRQTADDEVKRKVGRRALKTPVHGDCQVCGQPGHGSHFGVLACRACAAFFRRTVVMNRQYSCRRANGSCQISKDERYLCRLCRYNKCIMLGMTPDNLDLLFVNILMNFPNSCHTSFSISWSVQHHFDWDDNLRSLLLFHFYRGSNATQKATDINDTYGKAITVEKTAQK
ncbi:hypothetical protein Y032_1061g3515 [Ancylostoma ceylanicum]|uniref:Nuclear receptor domain-containing protein n=1 Tax=Ancylostoma ceylanicum TaxID=53326 RepID=A0A016W8S8_9BILA|nr:hypothetical protein Y032_1061g3515 [Ancylostoma ceylanicum]